jgi:hypothetical protein
MYYYKIIKNGTLESVESRNIRINTRYAPNHVEITKQEFDTLLEQIMGDTLEQIMEDTADETDSDD